MIKNILIPTSLYDVHAIAIEYVLKEHKDKVNVIRWFCSDFPSIQSQTFTADNNCYEFNVSPKNDDFSLGSIDLVWYRRPGSIVIDLDESHPDYEQICRENNHFHRNIWELLPYKTKWVNHYSDSKRADCKLNQIRKAIESGLTVPKTISSNEPEKIKCFIKENKGRTLYKTFSGLHDWKEENKVFRQHATPVTLNDLPDDEMLRLSVGIFQEYIDKEYELRIFYIDGQFISAKIRLPKGSAGEHDWRAAANQGLIIEPYELPEKIRNSLAEFMQSLNLVTGSIDMIRDTQGEYVFLEVNESGQFIWLELENPEIKVLGPFCKFIVEAATGGESTIDESKISANDIFGRKDFESILGFDLKEHIQAI